ncbi:DUF7123 family protein [Haloarcula salina]|uniref:DUF7123 family protein n=1 Tax=Haloarcula salina TaxID=1429914 RepID=UPI003C7031BE
MPPAESRTEEWKRLERYLLRELDGGCRYFKSRYVAADVGRSPSEVGAMFRQLRQRSAALAVEKWGYTNGTTWRVERESA